MWALSLTRGWVCRLQMLPVLASAIIFGFESRGTRDHILLSQIRDLHFRRLLRLARLRCRYSNPPPHGIYDWATHIVSSQTHRRHIRCQAIDICENIENTAFFIVFTARCTATEIIQLLLAYSLSHINAGFTQQRAVYP
jgi:hypothetical protein